MDDELNLDELAALADSLNIGSLWKVSLPEPEAERLDKLIKALPRLIELARIGQSVKSGRITVDGYVKPNPIIIELDDE